MALPGGPKTPFAVYDLATSGPHSFLFCGLVRDRFFVRFEKEIKVDGEK